MAEQVTNLDSTSNGMSETHALAHEAMQAAEAEIRLLIVDDEPDIVELMTEYLTAKQFNCESASCADEALKKVSEFDDISVVLTDVRMPGMDGLEMLSRLREDLPDDREMEVIVITGHAGRQEAVQALHNGALDFLIKPVAPKDLAQAASHAVDVVRSKRTNRLYKQALETALETEKELCRIQREFVSMMSHEFRTPLSIIDMNAQRLLQKKESPQTADVEKRGLKIRSAVTRMTNLIDATLYASRMDEGKIDCNPAAINLKTLIENVISRQAELSEKHELVADWGDLPTTIQADEALLDQVFTNLLSNAVKYSPNSSRVEITGGADGVCATVTVRDYGVGIPAAEQERLFEKYFRASTSTGIPGTGIGLNIVKRFVEFHDGAVAINSVEGEGTEITVKLPVSGPAVDDSQPAPTAIAS